VSMAGTATTGVGKEARPPRRVVLLSESAGLAALVEHLLDGGGRLQRFTSLRAALDGDGLADADAVVLDLPRDGDDTAVAHARHHWKGRLVVLADRGRPRPEAPASPAWTFLSRPFPAQALAAALDLPGPDLAGAATEPPAWAAGDRSGVRGLADRALRALAGLPETWRDQRRVRVIGFSLVAVVAFAVAFALAAQDRCGAGCGAFGTGFSPLPTAAPEAPGGGPATTAPRRLPPTTAAVGVRGPAGAGAFDRGGRLATTSTSGRRATTTTRRPGAGGPGSTSPPTRPPTTPTTAPPTTEPPPTTAPPTTTVQPVVP
jgi:hypothetical protein